VNVIIAVLAPVVAGDSLPLHELLAQGGLAMYPIYACSLLTVGMFLKKVFELRAARLSEVAWVEGVLGHLRAGDLDAAQLACRTSPHPASRVVAALVHALDAAPEQAEAEAKRVASLELQRLDKGVGLLSFLAQVSPLLGLLGTVLGMVEMFMGLQEAGESNVAISDLASGIWKALLTTAAGLTVAVPALAGHAYLGSRIDQVRTQIVDIVQRVLFAAGRARED
jgi:biopolymer transport protein ExbB